MPTTLVLGATGRTGRLLVAELLARGHAVRALVRTAARLPDGLRTHGGLTAIEASVADLGTAALATHVAGCDAVASCLGHNVSWRGIYGPPRRLVTDTVRRVGAAVVANRPPAPVRFVLMSSAGVRDPDGSEHVSAGQRAVLALLRALVPPHADNERAAAHLRRGRGPAADALEWTAVRPDSLVDADAVSAYDVHPSPVRSALFDPGRTSRVNVAHFMAELITAPETWQRWRGRMPVVYNREAAA